MDNHNNYNEQIPNGDLEVDNGNLDVDNGDLEVDNGNLDVENGNLDIENGDSDVENGDSDVENETPYVNHNREPLTPQKKSENQPGDIEDSSVYKVLQESFIRASITKYNGENEKNETARVLFNKLLTLDIQQDVLVKTLKRGLYYLSSYSRDHKLVGQITDILIRNSNE